MATGQLLRRAGEGSTGDKCDERRRNDPDGLDVLVYEGAEAEDGEGAQHRGERRHERCDVGPAAREGDHEPHQEAEHRGHPDTPQADAEDEGESGGRHAVSEDRCPEGEARPLAREILQLAGACA